MITSVYIKIKLCKNIYISNNIYIIYNYPILSLVGALTQRSGTDLRAQIDKILNLVKNKDYPGKNFP